MPKSKIIAICGKAGSGKDTLLHILANYYDVHEIISCTTRPIREGEKEGVNYFYLTPEQFAAKLMADEMIEATEFNHWFYGTMKSSLNSDGWNIGVFNPEGVEALLENRDLEVKVFYIEVSDKIRLLRQLNREENPDVHEIIRRFTTDEQDFKFLPSRFEYIILMNDFNEDLQDNVAIVADVCGLRAKLNNPS